MKTLKLISLMLIIGIHAAFAVMPEGGTGGNGQLVVIPQHGKKPVPYEMARSIDSGVYRSFSKLPGLPGNIERRARFDKHYGVYATEWLEILKEYSPKIYNDLKVAGESTIIRFMDSHILWEHEAYPNDGTDYKRFEKAAFYNGEIIFSIPVMEKIGPLENILTKEENQGFVVIHELINAAYTKSLDISSKLKLGEIIANIRIQHLSREDFHREIIAHLKTVDFIKDESIEFKKSILKGMETGPLAKEVYQELRWGNKELNLDFLKTIMSLFAKTKDFNELLSQSFDQLQENTELMNIEILYELDLTIKYLIKINFVAAEEDLPKAYRKLIEDKNLLVTHTSSSWDYIKHNNFLSSIYKLYSEDFAKFYLNEFSKIEVKGFDKDFIQLLGFTHWNVNNSLTSSCANYPIETRYGYNDKIVEKALNQIKFRKYFGDKSGAEDFLMHHQKTEIKKNLEKIIGHKFEIINKQIPLNHCFVFRVRRESDDTIYTRYQKYLNQDDIGMKFKLFDEISDYCSYGATDLHRNELYQITDARKKLFKREYDYIIKVLNSPEKARIGQSIKVNESELKSCSFIQFLKNN